MLIISLSRPPSPSTKDRFAQIIAEQHLDFLLLRLRNHLTLIPHSYAHWFAPRYYVRAAIVRRGLLPHHDIVTRATV